MGKTGCTIGQAEKSRENNGYHAELEKELTAVTLAL